MSKHARLSASSAHRWMHCTGSPNLCSGLPEVKTSYQTEGTAAHNLAAYALQGNDDWRDTDAVEADGEARPVDAEMREGVQLYVDYVRHLQALYQGKLYVETTVDLAALNPPEEMFGTADTILWSSMYRRLDVVDLKYGQGVAVNAPDNEQLMEYVLGALLFIAKQDDENTESALENAFEFVDHIEVHIVQPRAQHSDGPIRSWEIDKDDITTFAQQLLEKARETQDPNAPLMPGDWCRFCPAQGVCPALKEHAQLTAQMTFGMSPIDTPVAPERLTLAETASLLRQLPILENWIRAVRQRIEAELSAGREVPGWKLVQKRPLRHWSDTEEVLRWAQGSGLEATDVYVEPELRSPAQMEKLVGKKNVPEELYEKKSSGLTLAPESDPRPAVAVLGLPADYTALPPAALTEEEE